MVRIIFTAFRRRWFFPQAGYVDAGSPDPRPYRVRAAATVRHLLDPGRDLGHIDRGTGAKSKD
jgi:predicted Rdx family selenoprotein